jgi:hypothetical protein
MDEVRSIIYIWWRKSELEKGFVKFGDHTEPLSNKNWRSDTEKYIQKTAAPREKAIFKDIIDYEIIDVTDYAKKINKNYKFAKIDNYISRVAFLDNYRMGKTDQFKLPKFELDVYEFIDKIKEVIYGGNSIENRLLVTGAFTLTDIKDLQDHKIKTFKFAEESKENDVLSIAHFLNATNILIISKSEEFDNIIKNCYEFNGYIIKHNNIKDGQYQFASKKFMICDKNIDDQKDYDFIFNDFDSTIQIV